MDQHLLRYAITSDGSSSPLPGTRLPRFVRESVWMRVAALRSSLPREFRSAAESLRLLYSL